MNWRLDFAQVLAVLPHRYPIILVDRVDDLEPGVRLTARKAVSGNDPAFHAGAATWPATLLIESWCQAAAVLATWDRPNPDVRTGRVPLVGAMSGIRFPRPVWPGDVVEHHVRLDRGFGDVLIVNGDSTVDGEPVLAVDRVVVALRSAAQLTGGR